MSTLAPTFPHHVFRGGPRERGAAYGEALRDRIEATLALYADVLFANVARDRLQQSAARARALVDAFSPDLATELDAVARGANLSPWQIHLLNARTEILNAPVDECTALYFESSALLGQNWDWVEALEALAILVTWELPSGRRILAFTEPGMLGKIGMNDAGVGVCLNILFSPHALDGVPVHVLTRAVMDCASLDEARATIARSGFGKASHLLVGDASGTCHSVEFAGGGRHECAPADGTLLHTNHCLAPAAADAATKSGTTVPRFEQACAHLAATSARDRAAMETILLDDSRGATSINRAYTPEPLLAGQPVGTCGTFIMDLPQRQLHVKRGPGPEATFATLDI